MSKMKIVLNYAGVGELLKSAELGEKLFELGRGVQQGEGYSVEKVNAGTRMIVRVTAESNKAIKDNLDNNTLVKALGG